MIIIIRALSQWGKDDGDYDSPTVRDETSEKKEAKKWEKAQQKQMRENREGAMLLSFYHTCASK